MKHITMAKISKIEHNIGAYLALGYGVAALAGSLFKVAALQSLTTDAYFVPAGALLLFALTRHSIRVQEVLEKLASAKQLVFQEDIDNTYGSMSYRILNGNPKRIWATYLNPDAFATGEPPVGLKEYYEKAERFEVADYRRVFGIYPDKSEFRERRKKSIEWLRGHCERTKALRGYKPRYVELEFQAAEVLIDDNGLNFSFPAERENEAGWTTEDKDISAMMKDYFHQVWSRSRDVRELIRETGEEKATGTE